MIFFKKNEIRWKIRGLWEKKLRGSYVEGAIIGSANFEWEKLSGKFLMHFSRKIEGLLEMMRNIILWGIKCRWVETGGLD